MTRHTRAIWLVCAFALAAATSLPARAEDHSAADQARALELFEAAAERIREGRFREAIELLDQADRLKPSAILHYNKARALEGLGDKPNAIVEYEKYLQMEPEAADRGAVERRIAALRGEVEERNRLERERKAAAERPRAGPTAPPARRHEPSIAPWIVSGVGVVGLGVGVFFGLRARSQERAGNDASSQQRAAEQESKAEDSARIANIALIAGGAITLGGGVWGLIDLGASSRETPRASGARALLPASVRVGGHF